MTGPYPFPSALHYDPTHHMWVRAEGNRRVVVGIDVLGLETLGDLAYITLAQVGDQVGRGAACGTLEAAKMTGELVSPVSGRVVARNDAVVARPPLVNASPYDEGWMLEIEPSDWSAEAQALVSGDAIGPWVRAEVARYRDEGWLD